MSDLSGRAKQLIKTLFGGNETENMIAAGVARTIIADITRLFFENRAALGKGILVFNPTDPEKSTYLTVTDLESDLAVAQEMCHEEASEMFQKIIKFIEKESEADLALVALIDGGGVALHILDAKEANTRIDEFKNGLIY
jgi:hypothetical protein